LARSPRTLIRGEAGSGQSTILRWLAITAGRNGFTGGLTGWNNVVPFLVRLRRFVGRRLPRPEELLDHVAGSLTGLMPAGWVHRQLNSGRALLLVDGFDAPAAAGRAAHRRGAAGQHPAGERHRGHDHHDVVRHPLDRHAAAGDHVPGRRGPAGRGQRPTCTRRSAARASTSASSTRRTSAGSWRPWYAAGWARTSSTRTPADGTRSRRACCRTPGLRSP
jgi:hypothetical protein